MSTQDDFGGRVADLLAAFQREASGQFGRELDGLRETLPASCEPCLGRLRAKRFVSFDAASRLIEKLAVAVLRERTRCTALAADLEAARGDAEATRTRSQAAVRAALAMATRARKAAANEVAQELNAARELARSSVAAEAQAREELTALRLRSQEIAEAQASQFRQLQRELEQESAKLERLRAEAGSAANGRAAVKVRAAARVRPLEPRGNQDAPEFAAIDAVLAGSPPMAAWESVGAAV